MEPATFLDKWHTAVADRNLSAMGALIADDAKISSPAYWSPKGPKAYVMEILSAIVEGTEDFHYTKDWVDGPEIIMEFGARIEDDQLRGIDRITLGDDGRIIHLEVMIRPINALFKLADFVKAEFASEGEA